MSEQTQYTAIIAETQGRVATITLNRPEALNALSNTLISELVDAAVKFDADPNIGAIVITGSERAFAAGADIKAMLELEYSDVLAGGLTATWNGFEQMLTPTIAAVSGFALGGGCELAMMCDIIIAADNAKFGQPEINLGVIPGFGGTQRLPRAIGKYKAADLVLTGRMMGADEAERSGLVSRVVPAAELAETAAQTAELIASKSRPAVQAAKSTLQAAEETSLAEGLRLERTAFAALFATDDQKEGMRAFAEKREPNFTHR
ncbi:putative enoyl-CoA hydratase echA8 [Leucobacter aridicollis]|uniref:enoyl-CoA hydratase-related protein n=1 Tax=Leucobacter aridicollis TaxID=283878 RepID=UPI000EB09A8D|nr:enoyl-CoA hydratase-related protein [Leucobacter aridicollis]MCS3427916.1 enoyl-CoA hydratase [Leucobacter aridicollis]RKQ94820.1 enoyl-CoA hydratase [Mycolicibacterium mucogenicum 261Sha1.1M5]